MKKLFALLLFVLIACSSTETKETQPTATQPVSPEAAEKEPASADKTYDISAAFAKGVPVKCTMSQDGQNVELYLKGSKMRMNTMPADAHAIYTETKMYAWTQGQGFMFDVAEMKKLSEGAASQYQQKTPEQVVADAQQKGIKCEQTSVSDDMFNPPSDIQFQDMTALIKQMGAK